MSPASRRMPRAMPTPRPAVAPGERAAEPADGLGLEGAELEFVGITPVVEDCDELMIVATVVMVVVDVPTIAVIVDVPIMSNL
jgi:hypothetical protein